jgi:phosphate transport system substrate-binding protein
MASRALKDTELEQLTPVQIALDGIAVIVNKDNPVTNFTKEQVRAIYTGETTQWGDIIS